MDYIPFASGGTYYIYYALTVLYRARSADPVRGTRYTYVRVRMLACAYASSCTSNTPTLLLFHIILYIDKNHYTLHSYVVDGSVSIVTVFNTELATPLLPSTCPVPMLRTFCASSNVLSRFAAAVAEMPWF